MLLFQDKGIVTLSVDANFGLCRKKTAGSSVREPLSGTSIFCHQGEVNDYVLHSGCSSVVADAEKVVMVLQLQLHVNGYFNCCRIVVISQLAVC